MKWFKKKCNHEGKMYKVYDRNGWAVGWLCDCGHFQFRRDMPCYDDRFRAWLKTKIARARGAV